MAYDRQLSSLQPTAPAVTAPDRRTGTINSADPGTMTPEQKAYLLARQAGVSIGQPGPIGGSGQRLGTIDPYTAKATQIAQTLGVAIPQGPAQQTAPAPGGSAQQAALAPGVVHAIGDPSQNVQNGAVPGAQQGLPPSGGPSQQASPQMMAMIQEFMRQQALTKAQQRQAATQQMIDNRGVFAGQQQGAAMPSYAMPPVPVRR